MSRRNRRTQRQPSIVLLSDNDDDNLMDTQYSTPTASMASQTAAAATTTTNQFQLGEPPKTPPPQVRSSQSRSGTNRQRKQIELIDLVTPFKSGVHHQPNYIPRTLHFYNQDRLSILPIFPTILQNNFSQLLLTNIPMCQLSTDEQARRQLGKYRSEFSIRNTNASETSFMVKQYHTYYGSILEKFQVDLAILDYNYIRLHYVLQLFRTTRLQILSLDKCSENDLLLHENELPQLLEFYLQMDVDLFYMKTCSFGDAQPRSTTEGLFCEQPPECLYTMTPCGDCRLCRTPRDMRYRQQAPILFNRYEKHRFINGYESILNCPATCTTKNLIYVLTCLCGQYDYISETKYMLAVRFDGHCKIANNLILKCLIGDENFNNLPMNQGETSSSIPWHKTSMSLYKHTIQCSAAVQMFLNNNPLYWCFVPMTILDADQYDMYACIKRETIDDSIEDNDIGKCLADIPKSPSGYKFSKRQIEQQKEFFQKKLYNEPIYDRVPLHNAQVIAVLPPNTSNLFRRIIHSLFVTHTEAKLNTLGHLFNPTMNINFHHHSIWCANLVRPSISSL
ncbi:unnamed protein product [Rotaria magnacalcarata]|uniref:Uncharacterized protein n=1 Tax=Rotaria magnacalcarata TaxID=392030 RepID=A0A816SHY1_9BILA|nr:unnamed protein product [Rotaria magnacalcarata]CAF4183855.1 unnamed protein product [Rotaria magnacalcarata]